MRWKNAALLALAVTVVGCSSNSKKELAPAELPEFTTEVELKSEWSRSVGNGQGEGYNLLTPAVDGDHIYAADVEGVVMAMDRFSGDVLWEQDLELPVSGAIGAGAGQSDAVRAALPAGGAGIPLQLEAPGPSRVHELTQLARLFENDLITREEYEISKKHIIEGISGR